MMFRPSHVVVGALALMAGACSNNDNFIQVASIATVRLVNDTDTPLSLTNAGVLDSANVRLVFGQASTCVIVNLTNPLVDGLVITNGATGATIPFTPTLRSGDNMTIVAFGATAANVQFAALDNHFVPAANSAGLRFFNGVASTAPLLMQRNGGAITPLVRFGLASSFVSVPIDSGLITFSDQNSVVLDAGRMAFPLGQNSMVVLGPPAPETNPLRFFTVQGC
jgi:hypothetical protein